MSCRTVMTEKPRLAVAGFELESTRLRLPRSQHSSTASPIPSYNTTSQADVVLATVMVEQILLADNSCEE